MCSSQCAFAPEEYAQLAFVIEMRSLAHVLGQMFGRTFQAGCDAALATNLSEQAHRKYREK